MTVQRRIEEKLGAGLGPTHLEVVNESDRHNVPPGSESHFKVVVVSAAFEGVPLVRRHRMVYDLLGEEMAGPVHALALHTYAGDDWQPRDGGVQASPQCLGGKARETA